LGVHETHSADIVQETFLALYKNLDKIQAAEALPSWLSTTATRLAYRHLSRSRTHLTLEDSEAVPTEDPTTVVLDLAEQSEIRHAVETALKSMSHDNAELFRMLEIEGLSYAEVSGRTGRPAGSIGPTRMRCLAKLRQLLEKEQYAWAS
jgi:RNA polymerase sigma factor (sigma-70 family)